LLLCTVIVFAPLPLLAVDAQQHALDSAALLARTPAPAMRVVLGDPVTVDVRLQADIDAPRLEAKRWQFVVAGPAVVPGQRVLSSALVPTGRKTQDRSPWKRPLLIGELDAGKRQQQKGPASTFTKRSPGSWKGWPISPMPCSAPTSRVRPSRPERKWPPWPLRTW
jgi:hypothetical protein